MRYRFADASLDTQRYELQRADVPIPLPPKVYQVLAYLLAQRDRVVPREELLAHVWPGVYVSEATLNSYIMAVRQALGDDGQTQRFVRTVRGRGYRFVARVEVQDVIPRADAPPLEPPRAVDVPAPILPPAPAVPAAEVTSAVAASSQLSALSTDGEYKPVSVLCCGLSEATTLAMALGPEGLYGVMQRVVGLAYDVVQRYAGLIIHHTPEGLVAVFGAPMAEEDHARRAVLAALDLQQCLPRPLGLGAGLAVSLGVHSGLVVVGGLGPAPERLVTAVGAPTQVATRLQQRAAPGTILVSDATYRLVHEEVRGAPCGTLTLAGQHAPLPVYTVQGLVQRRAGVPRRARRSWSPCVGRQRELALLHDRLETVRTGAGQVVSLVGPPGIGKSRLVTEFRRRLSPDRVAWYTGQCLAYGQTTPYLPVRDIVQQICAPAEGDGTAARTAAVRQRLARLVQHQHECVGSVGDGLGSLSHPPKAPHPNPLPEGRGAVKLAPLRRRRHGERASPCADAVAPEGTEGTGQKQHDSVLGRVAEEDVALLLQLLDLPVAPALLARLSPETRQARTFALLWHLILHEAQQRPLVLAVEDMHWIDPTSEAWLAFLTERLAGAAVLLLVTQRPGYQPPWGTHAAVTQLALPPLRAEDSRAVVEAVPGTAQLPAAQCQQIVAHGAGNPFFVEELAWHAVEHGLCTTPVPETVHAVLAARIDRLPAAEKSLLQTAAVIGHEVPLPLMQAIAALPEEALQRCLAHLQATEFLYEVRLFPERAFTFKHALTQEVAYESLLQERRRVLHARVVEALAALAGDRETEQVERLAHHALRGEVWDRAVVYCRQAGEKAMAHSTLREARAYFEQALTALQYLPERRETIEQAIDLRLAIRSALIALRDYAALFDHLRAAETLATALDDPRRLGWVSTYMVNYYTHMGDYERALVYGQRALAAASRDFALEMMGTFFVGLCYLYLGRYRQAVSCHRRNTAALVGARLHERFGEAGPLSVSARAFLAWGLAELGDFAEGSARGAEAVRIAEAVDQPFTLSHAYLGSGFLYVRHGDLSQAIAVLERGLAVCQTGDMPLLLPHIAAGLGYAYALSGRLAEALPLLEQAVAWVTSGHRMGTAYPLWIAHLGEAYLLAGRPEDANQLARRALAHTRGRKQQGYEAYALRLLGEVARQRAPLEVGLAAAAYQQAITLAEALGMRPLLAHCHLGLGTMYTQAGQREQARAPLSIALALYRAMGMTFWLPQAEATLAQVGAHSGGASRSTMEGVSTVHAQQPSSARQSGTVPLSVPGQRLPRPLEERCGGTTRDTSHC